MHCTYAAKFKTGVMNSSFFISDIATKIHACPVCMFQCALLAVHNVWSLNLAHSASCVMNFAVSYRERMVHALFPIYKPMLM